MSTGSMTLTSTTYYVYMQDRPSIPSTGVMDNMSTASWTIVTYYVNKRWATTCTCIIV